MKHSMHFVVVPLLLALIGSPATASAQSIVPLFPDAGGISRQRLYEEGPSETGVVREERVQEYVHQASVQQQNISALGATPSASVYMPILFGVSIRDISPNFGDPRSGGRKHEGEDIMAVKGTPIVSPTPAIVLKTEVGPSEGNAVYTTNPGGEIFVYMHLDRFAEGITQGAVLKQGSLIGYVGTTGNASGGPAHLHFEIRNSSGSPTDPFPRLTADWSIQERIFHLTAILTQTSNPPALSQLLVANFRGTFTNALAAGIPLPLSVNDALAQIPVTPSLVAAVGSIPAGDLDIGSVGQAVVALQRYLIQRSSGSASTRLAGAGATGNFGLITKAALVEYQVVVGISPASGYYGPATKVFIDSHPIGTTLPIAATTPLNTLVQSVPTPLVTPPVTPPVPTGTTVLLSRDLYQGLSGEDVRVLQRLLNAKGFTVAVSGVGSAGSESTYFGPATRAAVIKFQIARHIVPAVGRVGPLTRTALASN